MKKWQGICACAFSLIGHRTRSQNTRPKCEGCWIISITSYGARVQAFVTPLMILYVVGADWACVAAVACVATVLLLDMFSLIDLVLLLFFWLINYEQYPPIAIYSFHLTRVTFLQQNGVEARGILCQVECASCYLCSTMSHNISPSPFTSIHPAPK